MSVKRAEKMAVIPWVTKRFDQTGSPVKWMVGTTYEEAAKTEKAVAWADALVGIREHGENKGADVEEITKAAGLGSKGGYAWCAMFVYFILLKAGLRASSIPALGQCAAVRNWVAWGRENGRIADGPKRGRLFFWLGKNQQGHMGFCISEADSSGEFRTIEGNTNGGGSRDGDGSYKRSRNVRDMKRHHISGFIDLEGL